MFTEPKPTCSTLPLTDKLAQEIYTAMVKHGSVMKTFTALETNFDYTNVINVDVEIKRIHAEIMHKMSGGFILSVFVPPVMDEEGLKVITPAIPAVYFVPTTQKALVASVSETLLDTETVVADMIKHTPELDESRKWADFVAGFETEV